MGAGTKPVSPEQMEIARLRAELARVKKRELVIDALRLAWFRRRPEPGVLFHTDRGSQNCSDDFQRALTDYGMRSSMSRKGNCWDNAPTESLWGSLKVGSLHGRRFETRRAAMDGIVDWVTF